MSSIRPLPEFTEWLDGLSEPAVRGIVVARLKRLALGLAGDVAPIGQGVSELRIHVGAGWRVYFVQRGDRVIVLLAGGTKRTQRADIKRATVLASELEWQQGDDDDSTRQGGRPAGVRRRTVSRL
jgi:putative addiction module killer protein